MRKIYRYLVATASSSKPNFST